MPWRLALSRRAVRDLDRLNDRDRAAVEEQLAHLVDDPGRADLKKLTARSGEWRLRVGRWRVILEMDTATGTIYALRVLPRSEAYRE